MASAASVGVTPSISNKIFPGRTTATQCSGAPLPLPIRVSAGFLVTGLSGNRRIQILPPRLTKRVMATRLASICRSVIQPGSMTFRPKSPNDSSPPRQALPRMRPRCCLRYFTFFGINISQFSVSRLSVTSSALRCSLFTYHTVAGRKANGEWGPRSAAALEGPCRCRLRLALALPQDLALVHPALHADHAVRGPRFGKAVIDIGAQSVQRQASLQVPFGARDFVAVQTTAYPHLDTFAAKAQRRVHCLAHGATEADALLKLQRDVLGYQLCIELWLVYFENVDVHVAAGALLDLLLQLVDLSALAADDDAGTRGADDDAQLVAGTLDLNRADAR